MRTYLVTGGAGFIGSNYIHYMFKKYDNEIRIINVDKLTYAGNLENLKSVEDRENYTFIKADICDSETIHKIFEQNEIDRVVHFAAESHVDRQGLYVSCIEEIAYKRGFIDKEQLKHVAQDLLKTPYGEYLMEIAEGK